VPLSLILYKQIKQQGGTRVARFNVDKKAEEVFQALAGIHDQVSGLVNRARRNIDALESELAVARYPGLHLASLLRPLCGQVTANQITWCHDDVFLLGRSPWSKEDIGAFLEEIGFALTRELTPETTVVIGAHDLEDAEFQTLLEFGLEQELQILPQELFILGLIRRADPFELLNEEQIESIAENNEAIGAVLQHGLTWPVWISTGSDAYEPPVQLTDDVQGEGEYGPLDTSEWSDRSVLGNIGYSVRDGSLTVMQRRTYLETALTHDLSDVASSSEIDKWGEPGTTRRLRAIVGFLVWLNRTQSADKPAARRKRLEDLAWLRDRYDAKQTRIEWPKLDD
jgi:hypothetical protein